MNYFFAFLFAGLMCGLAQVILDNTKLTPGHVTTLFTILGVILGFLGLYEKLIKLCGAGALILISNFGYALFSSGVDGYINSGFLGILSNMLFKSSLVLVSVIVFSFIFSIFFDSKS